LKNYNFSLPLCPKNFSMKPPGRLLKDYKSPDDLDDEILSRMVKEADAMYQ